MIGARILAVALLLAGCGSKPNRRVEKNELCDAASIQISVAYPGAGPAEVEAAVLAPIEEAVSRVDGVAHLHSIASEGMGLTIAELDRRTDRDRALMAIRDEIERVTSLPEAAELPLLFVAAPEGTTHFVAIYGEVPIDELRALAGRVEVTLERLPGVLRATPRGAPEPEVTASVSIDRLAQYGLTREDVVTAIRTGSLDLPAGGIATADREMLVRTRAPITDLDELGRIVISAAGGHPVKLGDVADISHGWRSHAPRAELAGQPAVMLEVATTKPLEPSERSIAEEVARLAQDLPAAVHVSLLGNAGRCVDPAASGGYRFRRARDLARAEVAFPAGTTARQLAAARDKLAGAIDSVGLFALLDPNPDSPTVEIMTFRPDPAKALAKLHDQLASTAGFAGAVFEGGGTEHLEVQLRHPDLEVLEKATAELRATLGQRREIWATASRQRDKPELSFELTPAGEKLGLTAHDIGRQLRAALFGVDATLLQVGADAIPVTVRMVGHGIDPADRGSPRAVETLPIVTPTGGRVAIGEVVEITRGRQPVAITRVDQQRTSLVAISVAPGASAHELAAKLATHELAALEKSFAGLRAAVVE